MKNNGEPVGLADAGTYFHTDYSYLEMPARATTLYSIQVPKVGGDTLFADQYAAYDDLSSQMKTTIKDMVALHHYGNRNDLGERSRTVASVLSEDQKQKACALLDELKDHATQPKYQYRLKYGVGDVVVWDNASLLHAATLIDPNDARTLWRVTIKEERRPS